MGEQAHFEDGDGLEDRLRLVCADDDIASDYLPAAVAIGLRLRSAGGSIISD